MDPKNSWPSTTKFEAKVVFTNAHALGKDEVEEDAANQI